MSDEGRTELQEATLRGVRWISLARIIAETTALGSTVALARMIPPAEFGRAAVALIVVALAAIIGPAGLTATLVQRRAIERQHIQAAAFLSFVVGGALTVLTISLVPFARSAFGEATGDLLLLASPAWLISAFGAASQAMLQRNLQFGRIAIVDSVSVLAGAATALALALTGLDAEALIAGALVALLAGTALAVALWRPPAPRPTRAGVADVGAFALPVALSSFAYAAFRNVDYAILGARMSAADVGYYWRAYQLGVEYQGKISQIMLRISFPVYSRAEGLEDLRRLRMRIVRVHASVLVPLLAAFAALAPVAVPWIFGSAWEPSVVPAQIMAVAGVGYALVTGTGPLLVAIGRPGLLLAANLVELAVYAVMIYLLAPYGLIWVSSGVAAFSIVAVVLTQVVLLRPLIGLSTRESVAEALPGFVAAGCLLAALWALRVTFEAVGLPSVAILAVCSVAGFALYVAVLRSLFAETWFDLVSILRRTAGRGRPGLSNESA
jgi:O-antigen/teichoic acid export membrane protein